MNDPLLVRGFQCLGNLFRNRQRLVDWYWSLSNAVCQRRPFDQLQHQRFLTLSFFQPVQDFGFAFKAG